MSKPEPDLRTSLWEVINLLLIGGAFLVTGVLCALFYYVSSLQLSKVTSDLATSVIGNSIPVFLLFFLSALTLRRLNRLRKLQDDSELAEAVSRRIVDSLANPSIDKLFTRRTPEAPLIDAAKSDVLLIQETGSLVAETARSEILGFIRRGGEVRIAVTAPVEPIASLMALRNATLTAADALISRAKRFQDHLDEFQRTSLGGSGRIEVRYIHYPIGSTVTLIDAASSDLHSAKAVVRISGFKVPFERKPDYSVRGDDSPAAIEHTRSEAMDIFRHASKCVLLRGQPHIGKTTMLENLIHKSNSKDFFWILSRAVWDPQAPQRRQGFDVISSAAPDDLIRFASKQPDDSYDCKTEVWDYHAELIRAAASEGKVIVLDEIGPLQLQSAKFKAVLASLFSNPSVHLFASISEPSLLGAEQHQTFWSHFRTTRMMLDTRTDREAMLTELARELSASRTSALAWAAIKK